MDIELYKNTLMRIKRDPSLVNIIPNITELTKKEMINSNKMNVKHSINSLSMIHTTELQMSLFNNLKSNTYHTLNGVYEIIIPTLGESICTQMVACAIIDGNWWNTPNRSKRMDPIARKLQNEYDRLDENRDLSNELIEVLISEFAFNLYHYNGKLSKTAEVIYIFKNDGLGLLTDIKHPSPFVQQIAIDHDINNVPYTYISDENDIANSIIHGECSPSDYNKNVITDEVLLKIIDESMYVFEGIRFEVNISDKIARVAFNRDPYNYDLLENPTEEDTILAIQSGSFLLNDIDKSLITEDVLIEAIKKEPSSLDGIKDPSLKFITTAIETDPTSIEFVKKQSEEMKWLALKNKKSTYDTIKYINNPTLKMKEFSIDKYPESIYLMARASDELKWRAIKIDPEIVLKVNNPTIEMIMYGMERIDMKSHSRESLVLTKKHQLRIVEEFPYAIKFFLNLKIDTVLLAIKQSNGEVFDVVRNACLFGNLQHLSTHEMEKIGRAFVSVKPSLIKKIDYPSVESQKIAFIKDSGVLRYLNKPPLKELAEKLKLNPYLAEDIQIDRSKIFVGLVPYLGIKKVYELIEINKAGDVDCGY